VRCFAPFDLLGVHDGMMSPWVASRISRTAHFLAGSI
jgi:hypothetical protein